MHTRSKWAVMIVVIIIIGLLVMNYFRKNTSLKQLMAKLDSTKVMLDSAQVSIHSSHALITNLQAHAC